MSLLGASGEGNFVSMPRPQIFTLKVEVKAGVKDTVDTGVVRKEEK